MSNPSFRINPPAAVVFDLVKVDIKMDYNIEPGIGTEVDADSFGDGLLEHERAYLAWLDGIYRKYPDLVIENCSSGGLRMDYAMLARNSIQSTSDQEDYRNYATISANAAIRGVMPVPSRLRSGRIVLIYSFKSLGFRVLFC